MSGARGRRHPPWGAALVSALLLAGVAACADDPTAVRIKLVVDPELNTEAQVLAVIQQLELGIDQPGGFAAAPAGLSLRDLDSDEDQELLFSTRVDGLSGFPLLRLRPGAGSGPVRIWARGLAGGQLAAVGAPVSDVTFVNGQSTEVSVPLDLRAQYRPPRVVTTLPQDGQSSVPSALGTIYVVFSKWIAAESIEGNLQLTFSGAGGAQPLSGSWDLADTNVVERGLPEQRTIAAFSLGACALQPGDYRIDVSTGVVDTAGNALDQQASANGPEPYAATFTLPGPPAASACGTAAGCTSNAQCDPSENPLYICVDPGPAGRCVPTPPSCEGALQCPAGYRCKDGEVGQPVTCEKVAACTSDPQCDPEETGLFVCAKDGIYQGQCVPAPLTCERVECPPEYHCEVLEQRLVCDRGACTTSPDSCGKEHHCNKETGLCVPCTVYPSDGCMVECSEAVPECPLETECNFTEGLCFSK